MGVVRVLIAAVMVGWAVMGAPAFAEDQQEPAREAPEEAAPEAARPPEAPKIGSMTLEEIRKALGVSFYFQGGYVYNTRDPRSQENDFRLFDHKADSFMLDLAQLRLQKEAPAGGLGYKFKLSFGETARFIHSRGLGDASDTTDLTEAYVDYLAPLGKGLKVSFGKFVTFIGAEVIEALDNVNYSRSFLFNYATPFTHTGFRVSYPFSDTFNVAGYLVNGWDNTNDNNRGKTGGLSLTSTPLEQLALAFNFMYGPEQDNNTTHDRFVFDWVGTWKATKKLTFVLNTDYATEAQVATATGIRDVKWYGVAAYARYQFLEWFSMALRGEYFNDPDGVRAFSIAGNGTTRIQGPPQALKEVTLTGEFKVAKDLLVRPEYRHDWSNKQSFDAGSSKHQDTVSVGMMYLF